MLWHRGARLQAPQESRSIPGSDVLRENALQASWRRDRQVAQRRILWRWTVWYAQRWAPGGFAMLLLSVGIAYLTGWHPLGDSADRTDDPAATSAATPAPVPAPAPVAVRSEPAAAASAPASSPTNDAAALTLRSSTMLLPKSPQPTPSTESPASPDTLTLQSEKWLHSKEP